MEELENIELINYVISILAMKFKDIQLKYEPYSAHDAYSFYLTGHCASFAFILYSIFEDNAIIYDSNIDAHVITKIGNNFYDIRGTVNNLINIENYQECPINYFGFIESIYDKPTEDHSAEIQQELIDIGKKTLKDLLEQKSVSR